MYGIIIWNPMSLLSHIQEVDYSATTRAGTFFAGLGWFVSQIGVSAWIHLPSAPHTLPRRTDENEPS